jgi:hypothetical protein
LNKIQHCFFFSKEILDISYFFLNLLSYVIMKGKCNFTTHTSIRRGVTMRKSSGVDLNILAGVNDAEIRHLSGSSLKIKRVLNLIFCSFAVTSFKSKQRYMCTQ